MKMSTTKFCPLSRFLTDVRAGGRGGKGIEGGREGGSHVMLLNEV